jgi:hypothetical protein
MTDTSREDLADKESHEYDLLLELEELESLLEEIEESEGTAQLPADPKLRRRLGELNIRSVSDLRQRITELHAQLDASV